MKVLPQKRDIDKAKTEERKREIDEGLSLAKSVDALREQLQVEKQNLLQWREINVNKVKYDIGQLVEDRDNLERQNNEARKTRDELLKPLDKEWLEVNEIKKKIKEESFSLQLSREIMDTQFKDIEKEKNKLSEIIVKQKQNEKNTEKAKQETINLKELAQKEYEMARIEREEQTDNYEQRLSEVAQRERQYEVALTTIDTREKEVKEKESELSLREKHLASQQLALKIVMEEVKNNASSTINS